MRPPVPRANLPRPRKEPPAYEVEGRSQDAASAAHRSPLIRSKPRVRAVDFSSQASSNCRESSIPRSSKWSRIRSICSRRSSQGDIALRNLDLNALRLPK